MICGIDEAGRGPLAGPVYAAAVILGDKFPRDLLGGLNDSKKLTAEKRQELRQKIIDGSLAWGLGWASHTEIDNINILQATLLAMKRAFEEMLEKMQKTNLSQTEDISIIVDGNQVPNLSFPCTAMKKADSQIHEVMAASILAKTARDSYMDEMALLYPKYGYENHKGYPTKAHREAVLKYGPSPIQRKTFRVN